MRYRVPIEMTIHVLYFILSAQPNVSNMPEIMFCKKALVEEWSLTAGLVRN